MTDLVALKTDHILYGLDCMISFAEFSDGRPFDVDLQSGLLTVGEQTAPISVVGSWAGPPTSSWLWGWANPGWQDLPVERLEASRVLQSLGDVAGIEEFTRPEVAMQDDGFGFEATAIACGLTSAAGAVQYQHSGGSAFFVMPTLPSGGSDLGSRHVRVITQGLQAYQVPHRPAVVSYLTHVGYSITEQPTEVVAERHAGRFAISFDEQGRLINIDGSMGGPSREPAPDPSVTPSDGGSGGGFLSRFRKK